MLRPIASKISHENSIFHRLFSGRRMHSLVTYSSTTIILTVIAAALFKAMQMEAEFAIAVTGSLIGGFLGAMLAAVLILDLNERLGRDKEE